MRSYGAFITRTQALFDYRTFAGITSCSRFNKWDISSKCEPVHVISRWNIVQRVENDWKLLDPGDAELWQENGAHSSVDADFSAGVR